MISLTFVLSLLCLLSHGLDTAHFDGFFDCNDMSVADLAVDMFNVVKDAFKTDFCRDYLTSAASAYEKNNKTRCPSEQVFESCASEIAQAYLEAVTPCSSDDS